MEEQKDIETVFTVTNEEISRTAVTQCTDHKWEKMNDTELICKVCESAIIVLDANKFLNGTDK